MEATKTRATATVSPAAWSLLTLGVVSASVSAILIRYASEADALAISFYRCALGAAALAPFSAHRLRALARRELVAPAVAGLFLALHFATWITSVELTTIALSVLLVSTAPVFVAGASYLLFHERLGSQGWIGIGLALAGTALIAGLDLGGSSVLGNVLALIGAVTAGGYVIAGSVARRTLGILEYAVVTYSVAALLLLPVLIFSRAELSGYAAKTWWAIAAIVAGPQLLGHTIINLVLKQIDPTTVSVTIMAEPVIATSLAFVLFDEVPSALVYPGGVAILAGIYLTSTVRKPQAVVVE